MKTLRETARKLWSDESAQGLTEYILLLVVVVALATMFKGKIMSAVNNMVGDTGAKLEDFAK